MTNPSNDPTATNVPGAAPVNTPADGGAVASTNKSPATTKAKKKNAKAKPEKRKVEGSVAGTTWVSLIIGALLLILLLVFILQNQQKVELQVFAWTMNFPIGVGMLIAAIVGALIMAIVGMARIMQLRKQVKR